MRVYLSRESSVFSHKRKYISNRDFRYLSSNERFAATGHIYIYISSRGEYINHRIYKPIFTSKVVIHELGYNSRMNKMCSLFVPHAFSCFRANASITGCNSIQVGSTLGMNSALHRWYAVSHISKATSCIIGVYQSIGIGNIYTNIFSLSPISLLLILFFYISSSW